MSRRSGTGSLALMDSGVEFTPYERAVEGLGPYCGHAGVRSWWEESFEVLPDLTVEVQEVRDLGDRTLVAGGSTEKGRAAAHRLSGTSGKLCNGATRRSSGGARLRE
jgi:hypothetical protein